MPDRSRQPNALPAVVIALAFGLVLIGLALMTTVVTAQDGGEATPAPTSEFDLNLQPTVAFATATFDPNSLSSLTGVNGHAVNASVTIRSGPGIGYARISYLRKDGWIDIVGWNGWKDGRDCSSVFNDDLDMWVQVQFGERRGWIARCVLTIIGPIDKLPIVSVTGERDLQR
ncbi:MAG: hypothetical protein ABI700_20565 [Chloroflexota bacterium]